MLTMYHVLMYTVRTLANNTKSDAFMLKGGTALATKLINTNLQGLIRPTKDIDLQCFDARYWLSICSHITDILKDNPYGLHYKVLKHRGIEKTGVSDSLNLEVSHGSAVFKIGIDVNINSVAFPSTFLNSLNIYAYDNYTMLTDKLTVLNSKRIYRRVKDMYDIYTLARLQNYSLTYLLQVIRHKNNSYKDMQLMLTKDNYESLKHAYSVYSGIDKSIPFDDVFRLCFTFNATVLDCLKLEKGGGELVWNVNYLQWGSYLQQ